LGYLPRVPFFNAFELGAERCESSNIKWWSIKLIICSKNRVKK
jgi:hypothetical protein